ncbi:iron-sulfur cluster protein isca [Cystoisospora suis]|uniref:Iron-sulfur cluster protein isca n=1 Tax=Cystoisospora suis TaxID=483139 RepID=A0A2C6KSJ1_9APIC|nr:iron-sulfur cluster protein isca [Cystoisospora suis]
MTRCLGSCLFTASLRREGHCTPKRNRGVYIHPKECRSFTRQSITSLAPFLHPHTGVPSSSFSFTTLMAEEFRSSLSQSISLDFSSSSFLLRRSLHSSFPLSYLMVPSCCLPSNSRNREVHKLSSFSFSSSIRFVSFVSPQTSSSSSSVGSPCASSSPIQEEERRLAREKREKSTSPSTSFDFARIYSTHSSPSLLDRTSSSSFKSGGTTSSSSLSSSSSSLDERDSAKRLHPGNERGDPATTNLETATNPARQPQDPFESLGRKKDEEKEERRNGSKERKEGVRKKKRNFSHPPLLTVTPAASRRIEEIVKAYNRDIERKNSFLAKNSHGVEDDYEDEEEEEIRLLDKEEDEEEKNGEGETSGREMKKEEEKRKTGEEEDSLQQRAIGIRIGLEKRGCSGLSYTIDVVTQSKDGSLSSSSSSSLEKAHALSKKNWRGDERIETPGGTVLIASDAVMFLVGTEIDFVDTELERKFVFRNPNEKYSCGCGKSFMT